ncbi:MAG: response regulator [Pseudomonadota bacterium]
MKRKWSESTDFSGDIFDELPAREEESHRLLELLENRFPDGGFQLVSDQGKVTASDRDVHLPAGIGDRLVQEVKRENGPIHLDLPDGLFIHAMPVRELDRILIFVFPSKYPDPELRNLGPAAVRFCVELFISQKALREAQSLLAVEKRQVNRRVQALEEKYQKILKDLNHSREASEGANIAKREFLANMSHEMRTPLNGIIGMAELVMETNLDDNQRDILQTINMESESLHGLIDDILDFSKIEAGKLELELIPFDMINLFDDIARSISFKARKKGLEFNVFITPDLPCRLIGDPGRLRQVIVNLADNALKFTQEGDVYVGTELVEDLGDRAHIRFLMKDTGVGIPKDKLDAIFEPFKQADGSTTRKYGGTGLGTAISKQLVEMMGGEIGVESEEGKGSTFWFTATFTKQTGSSSVLPKEDVDLAGKRVLLVDDNRKNRVIIREYLKFWGCSTVEAKDGEEALSILRDAVLSNQFFDLVLTDLLMPRIDGFDLAREIRAWEAVKEVPIIILTCHGQRGDGKITREIGIDGYLTKPLGRGDLYRTIVSVLGLSREKMRLPANPLTRHALVDEGIEGIQILLVEDYPTNQKVTKRHLNSAGYRVDLAENGQEAVSACKRKHYDLILMDCQMPAMDGFEATAKIRAHEAGLLLPRCLLPEPAFRVIIIAMTANATKADRKKCLDAGMDDYIPKPVKREDLLATVAKWTLSPSEYVSRTRDGTGKGLQDGRAFPDAPPMDLERALQEYEGDQAFLMEVMEEFLEKGRSQIGTLRDAASRGDREEVGREAHSIKGGAAILTADTLSGIALQLEELARGGRLECGADLVDSLEAEFHRLEVYLRDR